MKTYKLKDVKKVCDTIYGKEINKDTWSRWKQKLGLSKSIREVSESNMEQLLTLANMKRAKPYSKPSFREVVQTKIKTLKEFHDTKWCYQLYLLPDKCKGSEIGEILKMLTGREISNKTLYRWGRESGIPYSSTSLYTKEQMTKLFCRIL